MARFLIVWEMGGGFGHLMKLRPIARQLVERGHAVTFAMRADRIDDARRWFDGVECIAIPAPPPPPPPGGTYHTIPAILECVGWTDPDALYKQAVEWRAFFAQHPMDMIIFDYAPTALLASRGLGVPIVSTSNGFDHPPDVSPLPTFGLADDGSIIEASAKTEARMLTAVNTVLDRFDQPAYPTAAKFMRDADALFMATWPEIDHYGERDDIEYMGMYQDAAGKPATWPRGDGPRVVGYLQQFKGRAALIEFLNRSKLPCLLYCGGVDRAKLAEACRPNVKALTEPFDLVTASKQAEIGIHHGGLGSIAVMAQAGVPMLLLPRHGEQFMTAQRLTKMNAGLLANPDDPKQIGRALQHLLVDPKYDRAAKKLKAKYGNYDATQVVMTIVDRIEAMLA